MPESAADHPAARPEAALVWWGRAALVSVLAIAVANSVGWATGIDRLTRVSPSWPYAMPWSAALVAGLGVAVLVQSGRPSRARVWVGCGLAVVVGVLVVVFLAEYVTGRSFGIDQVLFPEALRALQSSWQGRPSPQTASSVLLLSLAVGLTRLDRRWTPVAWAVSLVATVALPFASVAEYAFEALPPAGITRPTGMGISMATAIVLLVAAIFVARPDRNPLAWLLARPDRRTLARVGGILAVPPILIGLARPAFLSFGLREDAAWVLSITVSTIAVGAVTFYLSQHEQKLLIEKELLSRERAELETKRTEAGSATACWLTTPWTSSFTTAVAGWRGSRRRCRRRSGGYLRSGSAQTYAASSILMTSAQWRPRWRRSVTTDRLMHGVGSPPSTATITGSTSTQRTGSTPRATPME